MMPTIKRRNEEFAKWWDRWKSRVQRNRTLKPNQPKKVRAPHQDRISPTDTTTVSSASTTPNANQS